MVLSREAATATRLYEELFHLMRHHASQEESRGGPVATITVPVAATLRNPQARVLFAPVRRPNHVFHVMEAIWMLGGERNVNWLKQFNKNIATYAEDSGDIHGAYGWRWRKHWNFDQLKAIVDTLRGDTTNRQCVLSMWDPAQDLGTEFKDRPCNTHIYFRITGGKLNMTVCNRSNDLVWGMMGSNIVHMTMLQELMAVWCGTKLGTYTVVTNNLHIYKDLPNFDDIWGEAMHLQSEGWHEPCGMIKMGESAEIFLMDCKRFMAGEATKCRWFDEVAAPMRDFYLDVPNRVKHLSRIADPAWHTGMKQWIAGR